MALSDFIDVIAGYLSNAISPAPTHIGPAAPQALGDLPAIVLSLDDVVALHPGLGATALPPQEGALAVEITLDLAKPSLSIDGDTVTLLSADRKTLQLPHGSVVKSDGTNSLPFAPGDLFVAVGATSFAVVNHAPAAGEVSVDPINGILTFGTALANAGTLALHYFVPDWDVETERYAGALRVEVAAGDAGSTVALSRQVEDALGRDTSQTIPGLNQLQPVALAAVDTPAVAEAPGLRRALTYQFDFEREMPIVRTAGGPIREIDVPMTVSLEPAGVLKIVGKETP